MEARTLIRQYSYMQKRDDFIEGLRVIFDARPDLKQATVSTDAGLDNSTIRKLLNGQNSSPRIDTAEKIASAMGYRLSTILEIGAGRIPVDAIGLVSRLEQLPKGYSDEALRYLDYLLGQVGETRPPEGQAAGQMKTV